MFADQDKLDRGKDLTGEEQFKRNRSGFQFCFERGTGDTEK